MLLQRFHALLTLTDDGLLRSTRSACEYNTELLELPSLSQWPPMEAAPLAPDLLPDGCVSCGASVCRAASRFDRGARQSGDDGWNTPRPGGRSDCGSGRC